jgi:hypothetical protein
MGKGYAGTAFRIDGKIVLEKWNLLPYDARP